MKIKSSISLKHPSLLLFLVFLSVHFSINVYGQKNYYFDRLTTKDGLLDEMVYSVYQDRDGYIWIGSMAGIQRYDGYGFLNFQFNPDEPENGLQENIIRCITQTSDNTIWAGTQGGGIFRYNEGKILPALRHEENNSNSLSGDIVEDILETEDGTVWIATSEGLDSYKDGIFKKYKHIPGLANSLSNNRIFTLFEDSNKNLWIGTQEGLNLYLGNDEFQRYYHVAGDDNSLNNHFIHDIFEDSNKNIWLATVGGGLNKLNPQSGEVTHFMHDPDDDQSIGNNIVLNISEDRLGNIWVATFGGGLNKFDGLKFTRYVNDPQDQTTIQSNNVEEVIMDREGNIWSANYMGGVNRFTEKPVMAYSRSQFATKGLLPNLRSVYESADGAIWVAAEGGVNRYKDGQITTFNGKGGRNDLSSHRITFITGDNTGKIWFTTTGGGVDYYENGRFYNIGYEENNPNKIHDSQIDVIVEDKDGYLWFGGLEKGISKFDGDKFEVFKHIPGDNTSLSNNRIRDMAVGNDGAIWIATANGLNKFKNGIFQSYLHVTGDPNSLPKSNLSTVHVDTNGDVWVGYSGGLARLNPATETFKIYTMKDGLAGPIVEEIVGDINGNIWVATHTGASRYRKNTDNFESFTEKDGFTDPRLMTAYGSQSSNKVFFAGAGGFFEIDGKTIESNRDNENLMFTDISIIGNVPDSLNIRLKGEITKSNNINLAYQNNSFKISFADLSSEIRTNTQYYYRVKNLEDNWTFIGNRNSIDFTYLDPGEYLLEIKTQRCQSVSCTKSVLITVLPPFWLTNWFIAGVTLFIIGLLVALVISRSRSHARQKLNLKMEVDKKTGELKDAIDLLRLNLQKVYKSSTYLKDRSGNLALEVKKQNDTAKELETGIDNILKHSISNTNNAQLTNDISQETLNKLDVINHASSKQMETIKSISEKIEVLEEIFRQTDILAINASVESARAGELGNGFSVIAGEIRKLAKKSEIASNEISASAKKGLEETTGVSNMIRDFIPEVKKSARSISEISDSSASQSRHVESMNDSLKDFLNTTYRNSTISEDIFRLSSEMDEVAKSLNVKLSKIDN